MGLADLLELLLGLLITGVGVRVILARELAISLLDLGVGSILGDAEGFVEVLVEPIILRSGIHLAPPFLPINPVITVFTCPLTIRIAGA